MVRTIVPAEDHSPTLFHSPHLTPQIVDLLLPQVKETDHKFPISKTTRKKLRERKNPRELEGAEHGR
jgi:hypothetical protein